MNDLTEALVELIRKASCELAPDIEKALEQAHANEEPGTAASEVFATLKDNVDIARQNATPICQDTGTPIFYVKYPEGWSTRQLREKITEAVAQATRRSFLRPNAVHSVSGRNSGDNVGDEYFPTIHFEEVEGDGIIFDIILKGGGCENVGAQYSLPDTRLKAGRDLEGVRRVVLDAVHVAQGQGCAPGVLGVTIGGDRGSSYLASKEVLLRKLDDRNPDPKLDELEQRITQEANQLGIGPMGFGGKTTVLGTKINVLHRLPASFFVSISYMCWAYRRRRMIVRTGEVVYE
jgi:fumarate hydratase class I